ncbi:MAG TPA: Yip1 family protein [Verrucomicrobiae bacterium]|nr:Yip1 family protein [Verrucomicrobiae bacterium]
MVSLVAMIRAISLVWDPATAWENIVRDRKSLGSVFAAYFLPVLLITALGEGFTLAQWRMWTAGPHGLMRFDLGQVVVFEALRWVATCLIIGVGSYLIWLLREPFYGRYNFSQALVLVMYSLGPLFLCRLLTGVPKVNLWLSWGVGIYFSLKVFYHGVRSMAKTDPGSAAGLYLISSAVLVGLTGTQRFMLIQCLTGHGSSINNFMYDLAAKI